MDEMNLIKIPKRVLNALLSSMAAGVVPRAGAKYIAIGRTAEITAICKDLENVREGGSATRFLIGKYGSGKSFLIQLMRGYAVERGFVCADADLSPERRLSSSGGGGLATYRELVKNLSTKSSPEGGALAQMISKWLSDIQYAVTTVFIPIRLILKKRFPQESMRCFVKWKQGLALLILLVSLIPITARGGMAMNAVRAIACAGFEENLQRKRKRERLFPFQASSMTITGTIISSCLPFFPESSVTAVW